MNAHSPVRRSSGSLPRHRSPLSVACMVALGLGVGGTAAAQERTVPEATQLDAVKVSATRVTREGFEAPTPTTVVDREALDIAGNTNVADTINELPAARPSMTPTSTTNNSSYTGGNFMDLRGLGFRRALVLVDGKRFTPTHVEGMVDMNVIPQGLVRKVEIVTGGASAAWGSDAVAGVANLMLDRHFVGTKGTLQAGTTAHGDRNTELFSLTWGTRFAEDRGHFIVSGDWNDNDGIGWMRDRDWAGWGKISNPAYTADNDEPIQLLVPDARSANMAYGGLINSGPLAGTAFDENGEPIPFTYGDHRSGTGMQGGDGSANIDNLALQAPNTRTTVYSRASFDFTENLTGFFEGSWARSSGISPSLTRQDTAITIRRENPFIPDAIATQMDDLSLATIRMGRYNRDYGTTINDRYTMTRRAVAGLEGWFGGSWSWDAYYSVGESEHVLRQAQNRIVANYNFAIDAIPDPVTGEAICRSADARADGCAPLNLFGENRMSQASLDYVLGTAWRRSSVRQKAAAFTLRGEPLELPAGPVSLATGAEWRQEQAAVYSDPLSTASAFATGNATPWGGEVSVKEGFGEVVVPLLVDRPGARKVDLNIAARVTDYSLSGTVETWKIGGTWEVNDLVRFRAAQSHDIRAPSLSDMFTTGTTSVFTVFDPELQLRYSVGSRSSGNTDLVPEEADTTTFGVVLTPSSDFGISLDYYDVKMDKAIITFGAADNVERCYSTHPQVCSTIVRDPTTGRIDYVRAVPQNLEQLHLRGADVEANWRRDLSRGNLALRGLVSYVDTLSMDDGITASEMAGQTTQPTVSGIGGQPHWRGSLSAIYRLDRLTLNASARYVGGGVIDHTYTHKDLNILEHSGRTYFDIGGSYRLDGITLFATVKNVADMDPPINGVGGYATTRALYDTIGRQYTVGLRFRF